MKKREKVRKLGERDIWTPDGTGSIPNPPANSTPHSLRTILISTDGSDRKLSEIRSRG